MSMEALLLDYQRMRRCAVEVEAQRVRLARARRRDVVARAGGARMNNGRRREAVAAAVAQVAASLAAGLVRAQGMLDQFYWGVWGSARRIKASAREVDVLAAAMRDAELGRHHNGRDQPRWGLQRRKEAVLQAVLQQNGDELKVGDEEGVADCVCWPVRTRLWYAWAHRRRRRLQDACSKPRMAN
eukprot:SAG11_NODE_13931_length_632_cov_10.983114_1_plen_184_part_10